MGEECLRVELEFGITCGDCRGVLSSPPEDVTLRNRSEDVSMDESPPRGVTCLEEWQPWPAEKPLETVGSRIVPRTVDRP